ncbi:MAG: response regulator [Syntrophales bacterium]|jgi:signal transduction histidine kinase/CheY-like chemotaxis protein|nr:response regulator [Syntrophales bacterium]
MQDKRLRYKLIIIVSIILVIPILIASYIYVRHESLDSSHVVLFAFILILGLEGIILIRLIFDEVSFTTERLKEAAEKGKRLSSDLQHEVFEMKEISTSFNQIMDQLEKTNGVLEVHVQELKSVRKNLFDIIDFLPDATYVIDKEGKVIAWNLAMETMTGISSSEITGKGDLSYSLPFYGEKKPMLIDYALNPEAFAETPVNRKGNIFSKEDFAPSLNGNKGAYIFSTASVLYDSEGRATGAIESIRDVSWRIEIEKEKFHLEERLHRAEKMEAMGTLAGGIAHDLNNILGVLVGYSELLLEKIPEDDSLRTYACNILKSGEKGAAIIQDLLTLARRGVSVSEIINLNSLISDYFETPEFERLKDFHSNVHFEADLDEDLLNIKGSPVHLGKTIMNLIANAAESMERGGVVKVGTRCLHLDRPVRGYDDIREGDYAVLSVSDMGTGISKENIEKIFEPFYTIKIMGRSGTGLGLTVVWGTVKDHNGYIDIVSETGKGSTFSIYLPVTREEISKLPETVTPDSYKGRGESILVVDDVYEQRELAVAMLSRLGYRVMAVESGEEAVEFLRNNNVDLIVLDMIMDPGMDGLETYRKIIEVTPNQKATIVSGFSETDRVKQAQALGAGSYVKKPYVLDKIGLAVRNDLDDPQFNKSV